MHASCSVNRDGISTYSPAEQVRSIVLTGKSRNSSLQRSPQWFRGALIPFSTPETSHLQGMVNVLGWRPSTGNMIWDTASLSEV